METTDFITFGAIAAIWGALSPLVISFIKNAGRTWPVSLKKWLAVVFAVAGALVTFSATAGLGDIGLNDWEGFWVPMLAGFGVIYPMAQVSYQNFWKGTAVEEGLANSLTSS
jgi:hypothetical protein